MGEKKSYKINPVVIIGCDWNAVYNTDGKEGHDVHLTGH